MLRAIMRLSWTIAMRGFREIASLFSTERKQVASGGPRVTGITARRELDLSRFIVLGEGLAAGVIDFSLHSDTQIWSFAAQMARQMAVDFPMPLIQAPGFGDLVGFPLPTVRIPAPLQTTVLGQLPPTPVSNLAVPGFRLKDALAVRPEQPLIHRNNTKQTAVNLTWGILPIVWGKALQPTQLEYALERSPTFAVVELGFHEALEAAIGSNPDLLPEVQEFRAIYSEVLSKLRGCGSQVLALTIPDPFDTAFFSSITVAAKLAMVQPSFLLDRYGLQPDDLLTLNGLNEIGFQIFGRKLQPLPQSLVLSSGLAQGIGRRIRDLNSELTQLAGEIGALVYDLAGLFRRVTDAGYRVGERGLTGEYLGGFYSLNGYFPGQTGHAIIANEILSLINTRSGTSFPLIDLDMRLHDDPAAACRPAQGSLWQTADLEALPFNLTAMNESVVQSRPEVHEPPPFHEAENWEQLAPLTPPRPAKLPLQLPAGLQQVLPLDPSSSYFGDGISALNVRNPQEVKFGSTANFIFGGLAMVDSHLTGNIKLTFTPPANHLTHFEVSFMGGFTGEDSVLMAPQYFKMAFRQNRVEEATGLVSTGDLNLETGEVSNLTLFAGYRSTALNALRQVNPSFPKGPITFRNPPPSNCPSPKREQQAIYASAWAEFEQREDGKLDFLFYGSMFVPLGPGVVWPLNFAGPSRQFATIPAAGTVMHPHLQLSTRTRALPSRDVSDAIPFNTVQEFTLLTRNSAFGDAFSLNVPHLGGRAKGRSHLLGRLQIQFGGRTGNSVPVAVWAVPPGGIMAPLPPSPISRAFPSRLANGPQGFNETLRFPMRNYPLDDVSIIDDPFDISVGAIDLPSGRLLNSLLHRAFISQDLLFALLRVEPCTPQSSFLFRGPAEFLKSVHGENIFRFQGIAHIPYPAGLKFPNPDFATASIVGPDSSLDPFLWFRAIQNGRIASAFKEGRGSHMRSSTGEDFSYYYRVASDPHNASAVFEYENHSQEGNFHLHSLAWLDFSHSGTSSQQDDPYDTVSFSGFGIWSKNGVSTIQQVAVQVCSSSERSYVGIQVANGDISNVNTKPADEQNALP
jgi:hypothetical protein